jgi:N utilization substance protein B
LSILRLSLYEIDHIENIPVSVTINEAVELAKKYGGDGDSAFINGILGTVARSGEARPQDDSSAKVE